MRMKGLFAQNLKVYRTPANQGQWPTGFGLVVSETLKGLRRQGKNIVLGEPQAEEGMTAEDLRRLGYAGIYELPPTRSNRFRRLWYGIFGR